MQKQPGKVARNLLKWAAGLALSAIPVGSVAQEAAAPAPAPADATAQKPNIVLIVADDLGYGELSCQGGKTVYTPNIDSIARNGVRFTDGYVSSPVCSPSRAGIITGQYQTRFGYEFNSSEAKLPLGIPTLPRRMFENGYAAALFGKWHLGEEKGYRPLERGFDRFWGFLRGGHSYRGTSPENPIIDGFTPVEKQDEYLTDAISNRAANYIRANQHRPFFLMVSYNAVHTPVHVNASREARFSYIPEPRERALRTMLAAMDDGVGKILLTLRKTNMLDRTLVIFVSDNGNTPASQIEDNGGFRAGKASLYEGGIRVPMMMQWPGVLPAGVVYEKPVISLDLTATIIATGGGNLKDYPELDGVDLRPYLTGENNGDPHEALFWRIGQQRAVRKGKYKLVQIYSDGPTELYDLSADPGETANIADQHPEVVRELEDAYAQWNKGNAEPLWGRSARAKDPLDDWEGESPERPDPWIQPPSQ